MSDVIVIKRDCQRCPAVDEVPVTAEDIKTGKVGAAKDPAKTVPKYEVKIAGKVTISYEHLCPACDNMVSRMIDDMGKKRDKKTSRRSRRDD